MMIPQDHAGLIAVVTGGASGIGRATVHELAARGARVASLDVDTPDLGSDAVSLTCDITDRRSVDAALARVHELFGGLDVLVNNAGVSAIGTVSANDDDQWLRVLDVNVVGVARVTRAALPLLRRSPAASVVNLGSIAAVNGLPERALYSASKGAVHALTLALATDHVREGIRVNCVAPGTVDTPFVERMLQGFADPVAERAALDARQATGRMVTSEEVASAVAFIAGPAAASITGSCLLVDGGVTALRVRPL
ncbi:SDR family NAD(P)-dependent oxidoreductase [Microbacterium sp. NPDC090007]|uniref:SDR family NAD(P)-dependent oxidoreductase n=1 Tax=Microbacterium sp. NPDC090007 TaxID=3364204 RepID=UPI00382FD7E6